jgi:hypothetical protein
MSPNRPVYLKIVRFARFFYRKGVFDVEVDHALLALETSSSHLSRGNLEVGEQR